MPLRLFVPSRSAQGHVVAAGAPPRARAVIFAALAIAIASSTQYLFQPFIWDNWPMSEVLGGWVEVIRDRCIVALPIAGAIIAAGWLRFRSPRARAASLGIAIAAGAAIGELALLAFAFPGERTELRLVVGRIVQWSIVGGSLAIMAGWWMHAAEARARMQAEALRRADIEHQLVQTRLRALRNQIEPHFLFNTLATVRRMAQAQAEGGDRLLHRFLDYLRLTVAGLRAPQTTLREEIALIHAYLDVVEVRMSGRLRTRIAVPDEALDHELPALALATLVENAVKHGVGPKPEGGLIEIVATREGDALRIVVADDGVGFTEPLGSGLGLSNIRARLKTAYGARAQLALESRVGGGVRATLALPCGSAA